jgi:hypothetical protein
MKIAVQSSDAFNIVTVGSWNPAIFSPEWAKQHLAENTEQEVVLAIPMNAPMLSPRLTVDSVNIYPSPQSLVLDCVQYADGNVDSCAEKLRRIAELLPHTPVSAVGINFRFVGSPGESTTADELFAFADAANIDARTYSLTSSLIRRAYSLGNSIVLNVAIESLSDQMRFEFNFHSDVKLLAEVIEKTNVATIHSLHDQAIAFLSDVYGFELDA